MSKLDGPSLCLEWLLPLTGFGTTESGVYRRVLGSYIIVSTLVFIASRLAIAVPDLRGARISGAIVSFLKERL